MTIENTNLDIDPQASHYDVGGISVLDILEAKLSEEQYIGFLLGNIVKYATRANHKGSFESDVRKAGVYGRALLDHFEKVAADSDPEGGSVWSRHRSTQTPTPKGIAEVVPDPDPEGDYRGGSV